MARIHNFSAGPGVLPEPVLKQAQQDLWDHAGYGIGILECSHRSAQFDAVVASAKDRLRRLMKLDDDQVMLFLHGGASTQFFMVAANLLRGGRATYLDTGRWAALSLAEARRYGTVDVPFSSKGTRYDHVPAQGEWGPLPEGTAYLHYTSNNTVAGTEYHYTPDVGVPLVCDASSDILSRPWDYSKMDLIYAGAQKNMGPSGVTFVVIRQSLLERCDPDLPTMLRYGQHAATDSMHNTPCTFGIYVIEKVAAWLEDNGGLEAMGARNEAQAAKVYAAIDGSSVFRALAREGSRSLMNVTFTTGDADLDTKFWKSAAEHGLSGLKGHKSVGGLRASLYNAQTDAAVDALVAFMHEFERTHG